MEIVVGLSVLSVSFLESSGKKGETVNSWKKKSIKGHEAPAAPPHKVEAVGETFFIFFQETPILNTLILPPHKTSAPHLYIHGWSSLWQGKTSAHHQNRVLLFISP